MITESFLNTCYSVVLGKSRIRKDNVLYRDIIDILNFYIKHNKDEIPIIMKPKIDCILKICELRLEGKELNNILDSIFLSEKFQNLSSFVEGFIKEIPDHILQDNIKQIRLRKKLNSLLKNYDKMSKFLYIIKEGSFASVDDVIDDYDMIIKSMYADLMDASRGEAIEASSSLDLEKDDYHSVINLIKQKYERKNTTPSGFPILDNEVLNGGFEKSRLYIIGGASGSGKSTFLVNLMVNSATIPPNKFHNMLSENESSDKKRVYVYITLENTIEESLMRIYQAMFSKTSEDMLREISLAESDEEAVNKIKNSILNELRRNNSTIIMKYFPPSSISSVDIMAVLDDIAGEYGQENIAGIYIDYLDLLKTDTKYDIRHLELGHIALSLKTLAVHYEIPVITATQLTRAVYRVGKASDLNVDQIGESIKKVEHADFVLLLTKDINDDSIVHTKVGKFRNGRSNITMDFKVNFKHYKFLNGYFVSNEDNKFDDIDDSSQNLKKINDDEINLVGVNTDLGF